eukprot:TRINITY_DN44012_c0_g1_i1.p1 TRINITY_DN44012_c0_g1~~TRINITY_DN44012_c0_g1_i1.p1  ORF type:complete len:457 (+),score=112.34 TRINITY_DN44012_c0_g1_i1:69-1439(+)
MAVKYSSALLLVVGAFGAENCFVSLSAPLNSPPFDDDAVKVMRTYFLRNINVNGTGAVVAARGDVPALPDGCCPGGYTYHWMRDGALSMHALQDLVDLEGEGDESAFAREAVKSYAGWVQRMQAGSHGDAHTEPKWNIDSQTPYAGGWCRPQTDGPPLRARALMKAADWKSGPSKETLWGLVKFDLDWVAKSGSISLETCDLWEETVDPNFLWNRAMMRAALLDGGAFASSMGDETRANSYNEAAAKLLGKPATDHTAADGSLTECPSDGGTDSCKKYAKSVDGAVILSIIHSTEALGDSETLANTVESYNKAFCGLYAVNQQDSSAGTPGVLYGRYVKDSYGGGNPWVLITSALASLLYQQAQHQPPAGAALTAWQRALNSESFDGSPKAFVAAGDAVLSRLHRHVAPENFRLFEQIDRESGKQYNAEDLTWSYAETLMALKERAAVTLAEPLVV